jgi:hypothetical protein
MSGRVNFNIQSVFCRVAIACTLAGMAGFANGKDCDRSCLLAATDKYLGALASHDPAAAPLSPDFVFIENTAEIKVGEKMSARQTNLKPGEGLWRAATNVSTSFSIHVPDPIAQSAGWMGMMQESGKPVFVAIRLQLTGGKISAAEHVITRGLDDERLANLRQPRAGLVTEVPKSQRLGRAKLVAIGATYYDALDDNNGSLAPFAKDCEREDNGEIAAGSRAKWPADEPGYPHIDMTCKGQLDSQVMAYIDRIDERRVFAADPVYGLAMGLSHFHHSMQNKSEEVVLPDGSKGVRALNYPAFDVYAAHIFKIGPDGQMHEVEAMGYVAPYTPPVGN